MASKLRAVSPDERPAPKKKLSVTEAAEKGTVREQLVSLRERVAKAIEDPNCAARDLAALTRRQMEITKEIEAIDVRALEESEDSGATPDDAWEAV